MGPVIECLNCHAQFTDEQVSAFMGAACPKCGTTEKPKLIGKAALAAALVEEYLEVKPRLVASALKAHHLNARQLAGVWLLTHGRSQAWEKFSSLPRAERRRMEKLWPGFQDLLEKTKAAPDTEKAAFRMFSRGGQ
jgi:hypothetical protein